MWILLMGIILIIVLGLLTCVKWGYYKKPKNVIQDISDLIYLIEKKRKES